MATDFSKFGTPILPSNFSAVSPTGTSQNPTDNWASQFGTPITAGSVSLGSSEKPFDPLRYPKETIQARKEMFGGGENSISAKLSEDIKWGGEQLKRAGDIAEDHSKGTFTEGVTSALKGTVGTGFRVASDFFGTVFANHPVVLGLEAVGFNKFTDWVGKKSQVPPTSEDWKKAGLNIPAQQWNLIRSGINSLTDNKVVQQVALDNPQLDEDLGRAINLYFAKETNGKLEPSTVIPRTAEQIKAGAKVAQEVPGKIKEKVVSYTPGKTTVDSVADDIATIITKTAQGKKLFEANPENTDAARRVAEKVDLKGSVDTNGRVNTTPQIEEFRSTYLDPVVSTGYDLLAKENASVNQGRIRTSLNEELNKTTLPQSVIRPTVEATMKDVKVTIDELGNVKLIEVAKLKTAAQDKAHYEKAQANSTNELANRAVARALRKVVEETSKTEIGKVNGELAKLYQELDILNMLNNKVVEGGRAGKYFSQITGNIVGATAGGVVGGLPGAAVGTVVAGELAKSVRGRMFAGKLNNRNLVKGKASGYLERVAAEAKKPQRSDIGRADTVVGAPKTTPRTKDILLIEKKIRNNVESQKAAIKDKEWGTVNELKKEYTTLVDSLKATVKNKGVAPKEVAQSLGIRNTIYKTSKTNKKASIPQSKPQADLTRKALPAPAIRLPAPEAKPIEVVRAKKTVGRDPKTGKFKVVYTSAAETKAVNETLRKYSPKNKMSERLRKNKQGGYIYDPRNRQDMETFVPSSTKRADGTTRTLRAEAEDALSFAEKTGTIYHPEAYASAKEILKAYLRPVRGDRAHTLSRTDVATAVDIINGEALVKPTLGQRVKRWWNNPKFNRGFAKIGKGESPEAKLLRTREERQGVSSKNDSTQNLADAQQYLREAKGLSASDIMAKHPDIQLKRDVPVTDIHGNKKVIPEGEALTPYELKGNKVLLQDGETYIVSKNQYQNVKGQSLSGEAKDFAPELKGTEEVSYGSLSQAEKDALKSKIEAVDKKIYQLQTTSDNLPNSEFQKKLKPLQDERSKLVVTRNEGKYSQYTLPGGENYKEILVKAPYKAGDPAKAKAIRDRAFADYDAGKITRAERDKMLDELDQYVPKTDFTSSHWDEPNVLFHIRMNERTYKGDKVSFLEETQSDWAREGRNRGFADATELPKNWKVSNDVNKDYPTIKWAVRDERGFIKASGETREQAVSNAFAYLKDTGVPSHSLLKNWTPLSVKRSLQEAVDSKSKWFAWINGAQTSARYNLATHLKEVNWETKSNGIRKIELTQPNKYDKILFDIKKDGTIANFNFYGERRGITDWNGKKLDEVLGKGLADSIMAKESGTLSGEGLKFGGEWAENLYDRQVGNIVKDLTGAKIENLDMGLPIEAGKGNVMAFVNNQGKASRKLKPSDLRVGEEIAQVGEFQLGRGYADADAYIITEVLGDGKFKAVEKDLLVEALNGKSATPQNISGLEALNSVEKTFDISQKTTTQQGIRLTPEVVARIKGESPLTKTPSGRDPLIEALRRSKQK